jgi:hypothetical protein
MPAIIQFWPIVISMIVSVILGFIWYGPLFGKKWMALSGIAMPEQKPPMSVMMKPIIYSLVGALFMSFMLSSVIAFHDAYYLSFTLGSALSIGFLVWLGFVVPVYLNFTGWEQKPWTLFWINTGYWLVFLLISSAIISAFA